MYITGPDKWADNYPVANGPRQSPIDIIPKEAVFDSALKPLKLSYDPANAAGILNNGHSFQVDFLDDADSSSKLAALLAVVGAGQVVASTRKKYCSF